MNAADCLIPPRNAGRGLRCDAADLAVGNGVGNGRDRRADIRGRLRDQRDPGVAASVYQRQDDSGAGDP
ncbi:MAG: hypothetical protein QOD44_3463 [Solirubrobacteraceae bacterium]|nr:hypothetical protein [Solirubrobacteraceae bacterium]